MSKRYGRNQRRRHREMIAALDNRAACLDSENKRVRQAWYTLESEMRQWDRTIADILGAKSILRRKIPINETERPAHRRVDITPVELSLSPCELGEINFVEMCVAEMSEFEIIIRRDQERLRALIHCVNKFDGGGSSYSISERALEQCLADPRALRLLIDEMAQELAQYLVLPPCGAKSGP